MEMQSTQARQENIKLNFGKMACLQAGTVLPATVEQSLENCLLVYVKHKSRIFRGVLFDEKNAIVWRAPVDDQNTGLVAVKGKITAGSTVSDGASRWSTRQASLFYRRQNNKSFPCRRIPSLFSDVKVLTDADLIKESQGNSKNMVGKSGSSTKRPTASGDYKTKQGQFNKGKEISDKKVTCASSKGSVKSSKCRTNRKRKSSGQDICDRPSKRKPPIVNPQGVQKNTGKKQTKSECKSPEKTKVGSGKTSTLESKDSMSDGVSSTQYKVLMTRPAVPVVPAGTQTTAQQRVSTVLVLKKVVPSVEREVNRLHQRKSLESVVSNLSNGTVSKNVLTIVDESKNQSDNTAVLKLKLEKKGEVSEDIDNSRCSELDVGRAKCCVPNVLTNNVEDCFNIDREENLEGDNSALQCCLQIDSKSSAECKRVYDESLLSDGADFSGTQELKTENQVPIKRSARISERKAKIIACSSATNKNPLRCEVYPEKSNLFKGFEQEHNQSSQISNDLSPNTLNLSTVTNTKTEHQPPKHKTKSANSTKYTQRMTWQLQPQVTPTDNRNPVSVGNIVWGKVHGHPWWPGKVLAISGIRNEDSKDPWNRDAHVSWFGSNTSSIMHLHSLQLFLPNFSKRHKKRKKGFYRVAVKEAQDALKAMVD